MDQRQIAKQMIQLNRTAIDNSFKAMNLVYDQNEKIMDSMLSQSTWVPENGRQAIRDWLGAFKSGCDDFKKILDDNYDKVESYFGEEERPA